MGKSKYINFKRNNYNRVWYWATSVWVMELLEFPLIYTLNKFKFGKKLYKNLLKLRFHITKKPVMPMVEYMITTRCTLNCKYCNSFMPYFKKENHTKIATFKDFKQDMDKLLSSVDFINIFGFVGGETLLASELDKMVEYACSKKQIKQVFIATNCTILPSEKLLKVMKNKKFAIMLSDYSHVKNIQNGVSIKYGEFKKLCVENNIKFNNFQEKREATTWYTPPTVYKDCQDSNYLTNYYQNKCNQICNLICDGVIVPCTVAPYVFRNFELTEEIKNCAINLRDEKSSKELTENLIEYFSRSYSPFCNYCHHPEVEHGLPCGEQVEEINQN